MKRLLLCLVPWMAAIGAAASETSEPAEVSYTHAEPIRNGVFRIGGECFVDPSSVVAWGWTASVTGMMADIQAEGKRFEIPIRMYNGLRLIPLTAAIKRLGGGYAWRPDSNILDVWGVVESIEVSDGKVTVETTLAAKPRVLFLRDPARVVLDMAGVRMDEKTRVLLGPGARAGQYQPNLLRVVLEAGLASGVPKFRSAPTRKFEYSLLDASTADSASPNQTDDPIELPPDLRQAQPQPEPPKTTTITSGNPSIVSATGEILELRLVLSGSSPSPPNFRRIDPSTIAVWVPGSKFSGDEREKLRAKNIETWTAEQQPNGVVYTFKLSRPHGVEISTAGKEVRLVLHKPDVGDGRLAGKTIVVDPGHGGYDTGAKSPSRDAVERDLTLGMAKQLSRKLAAQGATVIMTRKTDVFIPLKERSEIANRSSADLFVSVHINSSRTPEKTSGGITFYHANDPIGQVLADCVQGEISKASGIPSIGTWSDTRIYGTGFAVLRYAKMPAILIEVGFINNSFDRSKMVTSAFQESIAKAIVKGVRIYLGDVKTEEN